MEKVQRRATKLNPTLKNKYYDERNRIRFNASGLETGRLMGDLMDILKIFKGYDSIDHEFFLVNSNTHNRGHSLQEVRQLAYTAADAP